jgi:nucleoid-associated protein YgaU
LTARGWTARDQARANRQGWELVEVDSLGGPHLVIQRTGENEEGHRGGSRFPDSIAAAAYVAGRAEAGDARAKRALALISTAGRMIGSLRDPNRLIA